jgi:Prealbumin-like fold domain
VIRQRRRAGSRLIRLASIISLPILSAILTAAPALAQDDAALNIRKVDEEGNRLAGAVFTVEGMDGTFTTGEDGHFCVTGLPNDSEWLVTEITAPAGYVIGAEASQLVEVDDDGDCNSPDAVFVNSVAGAVEPTPTPGGGESPGQPTPRETQLGGNPTPAGTGGPQLPNTATSGTSAPLLAALLAVIAMGSLGALGYLRLAEARRRR